MSYIIIIRRCWCDTALNVHAPTEDKNYTKDSFYEELVCVFNQFPKHNTNILLNFNAKVGREDIFKLMIRNKSLYDISK
jgi:hypothetical protein